MKYIKTLFVVAFVVSMCSLIIFPVSSKGLILDESYSSLIHEMIVDEWTRYSEDYPKIPGGIALQVLSPKGHLFVTYGMGDDVTNRHHVRGASITKTLTATVVLLLQQEGMLNIEDTVTSSIPGRSDTYLPQSSCYAIPYKDEITIRQLLEHRAGVFDITNSVIPLEVQAPYSGENYLDHILAQDFNHTFTIDEIVSVVAAHGLSYSPPGTAFHYSDTGYSLLAKIVEQVSGEDFGEFVTDRLLLPNNLADSSLPYLGTDQTLPEPFVVGYDYFKEEFSPVTNDNISFQVGNGNLTTSPFDLVLWARRLYSAHAGLKEEYVKMMMDVQPLSESQGYGLGTQYIKGLGYGHSGAVRGYLSLMVYDPDMDLSTLVYTNVLNWGDPANQLVLLRDVILKTRGILGY